MYQKNGYGDMITYIKTDKIYSNLSQPRRYFDNDMLVQLANSIKQYGMIQPIIVKSNNEKYVIVAGERRWRAAKMIGMDEVPAIIKDVKENEIIELALIENLQREDLNPIEEAIAFKTLIEDYGLTQDEISLKIGKSRPYISNSIRLLNLNEKITNCLITGQITAGHARALLSVNDDNRQLIILKRILDEELNVRQTEKLVKNLLKIKKDNRRKNKCESKYRILVENIENVLGTKINIIKNKNKGKIEIEFYSDEDLQRIYEYLCSR